MAFADLGSLAVGGSTANNQTSLSVTTTQAANAGDLIVVVAGVDNSGAAADSDNAEINNMAATAGGGTWTKAKGWTNSQGVAQTGAHVSIWYNVLTASMPSGTTIATYFANQATSDASAMVARRFSVSGTVSVGATNQVSDDGIDPSALDCTTANRPALRVRGIASETGVATVLTATSTWTAWGEGQSATAGGVTEISARAEHLISTGTGASSNPTFVAADSASAYVAFYEDAVLRPGLQTYTPTFYAATVAAGPVTLLPGLTTYTPTFYAATVSGAGADQPLTPAKADNTQTFYSPTLAATAALAPSLASNAQSFPPPTASSAVTLLPPLTVNTQNFLLGDPYFFLPIVVAQVGDTLTPALVTNAQTFYPATVTGGTVTLAPPLYTDPDTLFAPTVAAGVVTLTPPLAPNTQTFFPASITASYTLSPPFFTNTQNFLLGDPYFFLPITITQSGDTVLLPVKASNTQTFFPATVSATAALAPSLYSDPDNFFPATVAGTVTLLPGKHDDPDTFFPPQVGTGAIILAPNLFTDPDNFFTPHAITVGNVVLFPAMYADPDSFFPAMLTGGTPPVEAATGLNHPFHANVGQFTDRT
jgi:hypothetical protein